MAAFDFGINPQSGGSNTRQLKAAIDVQFHPKKPDTALSLLLFQGASRNLLIQTGIADGVLQVVLVSSPAQVSVGIHIDQKLLPKDLLFLVHAMVAMEQQTPENEFVTR